jgi:hypothetical protein
VADGELQALALPELAGRSVLEIGSGSYAEQAGASRHVTLALTDDARPAALGRFDVVLCVGGLDRVRDPLGALRRLRALCDGVAVIETGAIALGSRPDACLWAFTGTRWTPTRAGLEGICRAAGFSRTEPGPVPDPRPAPGETVTFRAVVHAWR